MSSERKRFAKQFIHSLKAWLDGASLTAEIMLECIEELDAYEKIPLRKNEIISQKRFINYLHESNPSRELIELTRTCEISFKMGAHDKNLLNLTVSGEKMSPSMVMLRGSLGSLSDELISVACRWSGKRIKIRQRYIDDVKEFKPRKRA